MESSADNSAVVWRHLERAHILSQASAWRHFSVHFSMLALAISCRDVKEVCWQIPRLILAIPSSLFGLYPVGNTGRSNVGMFAKMPIPRDLEEVLASRTQQQLTSNEKGE